MFASLFVRKALSKRWGLFNLTFIAIFDCMNPNVLKVFYKLSRLFRVEVTYKLGIDQRVGKDTLDFIKHYKGSNTFTDPLDDTLLQITIWNGDTPINIFRDTSAAYNEKDQKNLYAFFVDTLIYFKSKTCKHAKRN